MGMVRPGQGFFFRGLRRWPVIAGLLAVLGLLAAGTPGYGAAPAMSAPSSSDPGAPTAAQMQAALLTAADVGPPFTPETSTGGTAATTVTGCQPLADMLNAPSGTDGTRVEAEFTAGDQGLYLAETLTTAADQVALANGYEQLRAAVAQCRSLTFQSEGSAALTFDGTPMNFGGPGSAALRLDGTYQGIQINGYIAVEKIGPVILGYVYFQVASGSSQLAVAYYAQAAAKARPLATG